MDYSVGNKKVLDKKRGARIAKLIHKLCGKWVTKNSKVLDVGCSSGIVSEHLAAYCSEVIGIDIDENALEIAKKRKKSNLNFLSMDAKKINFTNNSFDIIILNQVHYYFADQKKLFDEIYRVLKPGGVVFLSGTNKYRIIKPFEPAPTYYKSFWELKRMFSRFDIEYQTSKIVDMRYGSAFQILPEAVYKILEPLSPNFVWIMKKK